MLTKEKAHEAAEKVLKNRNKHGDETDHLGRTDWRDEWKRNV